MDDEDDPDAEYFRRLEQRYGNAGVFEIVEEPDARLMDGDGAETDGGGEDAQARDDGLFPLYNPEQMEDLPPPRWLVEDLISEDGLSILYGEPGSFKSFIALDMALRIAIGMDWHGAPAKKTGVIYIAGEGLRGVGKRIAGWRRHHRMQKIDAPFFVLPQAVQVLDKEQRGKLIRTIEAVKDDTWMSVGLVVVDTVSRSIAGIDENTQDTMTQFVDACDEIKRAAGGALLGIHHSGKDKERGMRGSSVLLGAVDASLRLTKAERNVTLQIEKQKDAEQSSPINFEMQTVSWEGDEEPLSTLIPTRTNNGGGDGISMEMVRRAFVLIGEAWRAGKPLSNAPQTKREGRFAPRVFTSQIGGAADAWSSLIEGWLMNGKVEIEEVSSHSKLKGLHVLDGVF